VLPVLLDAAAALTSGADTETVASRLLADAVAAVDGVGGALLRLGRHGLVPMTSTGVDLGISDPSVVAGGPVFGAAESKEPAYRVEGDGATTIAVPLLADETLHGVLVVRIPHGRLVTETHMDALSVIGHCAAAALRHGGMVDDATATTLQIAHAAQHDPLTGVATRSLFATWAEEALARTRAGIGLTGVLLIDLDELRTINESFGDSVGDEVVVAVANRLRGCLRPGDQIARVDGDAFAILLGDLPSGAVSTVIAERITTVVNCPYAVSCGSVVQTATLGIAIAGPQDAVTWESLLGRASLALGSAKSTARAGYRVYDPSLLSPDSGFDAQLAGALARDELVLRYQPVVSLRDGRVAGAEALLRWQHPERGLLGPDAFIPAAVASGAIVDIGRMVLFAATAQLAEWQLVYGDDAPPWVSVNVSARQLETGTIVDDVVAALHSAGLPGSALVLELTEDSVVSTDEVVVDSLAALRAAGVRVAIDDFGSAYSALGYLVRLPVDVLKVDKSFVAALATSDESRVVVGAVLDLAHRLGLETIAEGVEEEEQARTLLSLGCVEAQGFRFAKPLSVEEVSAVLASGSRPMHHLIPRPRAPHAYESTAEAS